MNSSCSQIAGLSAGRAAPINATPWRLALMLLAWTLWTGHALADPPIVNKPSGAEVKTYGKSKSSSKLQPKPKPGFSPHHKGKHPPHIVVIPKPVPSVVKPKTPQLSGIATPFPDSSVKAYPTKVEVRPAQPPVGPAYPLTRFSQFGRPASPFAVKPSVQQFLGSSPSASGIASTRTPVPSAISTTKSVSSFTPAPRAVVPTHPSSFVIRSGHPQRPEKWQKLQDHCNTGWQSWHKHHASHLGAIKSERLRNWGQVCSRYREPGWARHFHASEYKKWCGEVWKYRQDRCVEVWSERKPFWNHVFDNDWWHSCWWRKAPPKHVHSVHESPWWWWHACEPEKRRTFFGVALAVPAVIYDPGTTVLYDGASYYVGGELVSNAVAAREQAIDLANPDISGIPLPEPAPEGEAEIWLPLGVWALAQQQQGDPTMFLQLSVNKDGIVAGAYKNILTGDEQPIIGRVDLKTQRIAWHVGDATETVYETGLNSLDNDVASVFIHFGTEATQTWLLVKLPSPEMPPGPEKTPKID